MNQTEENKPPETVDFIEISQRDIDDVQRILDNMIRSVVEFCQKDNNKITASEKRVIKAMESATKDLGDMILALFKEKTQLDDMSLLEVVNQNREKILNDIYQAAMTPKRKQVSKEAIDVIAMVARDLI